MHTILLAVSLLWLQLFVALIPTWRDAEYYSYGWFVPFLFAGLAWRRWQLLEPGPPTTARPSWLTIALLTAAVVLLAPLRLIGSSDPGWRPPLLLHATLVVALTHTLLWRGWGKRISLGFAPVTLIALAAVPYPWQLEQSLIRSLTGLVIGITREAFLLTGHPVEILGERLAMGTEVVEVTNGCSGIRSLQSLVMVALFFGELFLLPTSRRLLLIFLAGLAALIFNTLRAFWLASVHFNEGIQAADAAHDRIGHTTFLLSAATLWLAAYSLLHSQPRRLLQRTISSPTS